ncbi:MAG: hypothetical protein JNM56_29400 [Planctomycetia bacterium]|nr:hypothetical protein [Planctomycetia bacterium]
MTKNPNFIGGAAEGNKRVNPSILTPVEFEPALVRAQVRSLMLNVTGKETRIGVLLPTEKRGPELTPEQKRYLEWMKQRAAAYAAMTGNMVQIPGQGAGNPWFPGGQPGVAADMDSKVPTVDWKLDWADMGRIPAGAKLAETITPKRLVIVSGSFPYKDQLELFRKALREKEIKDLAKDKENNLPKFLGFNVQRRTLVAPGGAEKEKWHDLDLEKEYRPLLQSAVGTEPDSADLQKLSFPGMVMSRPILARGSYPDTKLPKLNRTLREIGNKPVSVELTPLQRKLSGDTDLFSNIPRPDENALKAPEPKDQVGNTNDKEIVLPDFCLVRFIDVTAKPGFTYEYRVQVRLANPNYGKKAEVAYPSLADVKELVSGWSDTVATITLPEETYVYAHELDKATYTQRVRVDPSIRDLPMVQVHRWMENTTLNPDQARSVVPVGEWVIGDVPVRPGEYIGRNENVEVPIWFPNKEGFAFAVPIGPAKVGLGPVKPLQVKGIPVSFQTEDLLVDFQGGRISETFRLPDKTSKDVTETANVELLVMTPDGKLRVKNSRQDMADKDREERAAEWERWREEVRKNPGKPATGNKPIKDPFNKPK